MTLEVFAGQEKHELSMIEVARAILEERGRDKEMFFSDLVNEIQTYLEKSDADIREALPYFYADLNTDGSFIPLGENKWGLRSWYAIDEIDEEIITLEENDDEEAPKRPKQRVNAFLGDDEDAIDYNNDDPEDDAFRRDEIDMSYEPMIPTTMSQKWKATTQSSMRLTLMPHWMRTILLPWTMTMTIFLMTIAQKTSKF